MRALLISALSLGLAAANAQAPEVTPEQTEVLDSKAVLEEVLVSGEQPGPGLWKVTKGGNTLWVLGTYGPLPEKMTWRSSEVESVITESQRVVKWVNVDTDVDIGFFAAIAAIPSAINAGDNPDGAKLKDVVTPEAYEQWLVLKSKYIGRDKDVENLRPAFAALQLRLKAVKTVGLSFETDAVIWDSVRRLAKKHKVKILEPEVTMHIKIEKPRAMIKKFRQTRIDDAACFAESLAKLEGDLDALKTQANAWATGRVDVLKKIPPTDPSKDCAQMLMDMMMKGQLAEDIGAGEMKDRWLTEFVRVMKDMNETWLRTVETEMQSHSSVFAIAPITNLFDEHGLLQSLRDHGYEVEEP
jgi:uncharacterized protein YbaP (TraB family)